MYMYIPVPRKQTFDPFRAQYEFHELKIISPLVFSTLTVTRHYTCSQYFCYVVGFSKRKYVPHLKVVKPVERALLEIDSPHR